jgi:hypothetical protein
VSTICAVAKRWTKRQIQVNFQSWFDFETATQKAFLMNLIDSVVLYKQFTPHPAWPFVLALFSAVIGLRSRGSAALWAIGGAVFALFSATIISGLADATALPYTDSVRNTRQAVAMVISIVFVAVIAAVFVLAGASTVRNWWSSRFPSSVPKS